MARGRGVRAGIDTTQVVTAAAGVLTREGAEAMTVRRVARELGVAPNALYSHVSGLDDLRTQAADHLLSTISVPRGDGWRLRLEEFAQDLHQQIVAHPVLRETLTTADPWGEHHQRLNAEVVSVLEEAHIPPDDARAAAAAVISICLAEGGDTEASQGFAFGLRAILDAVAQPGFHM